jgi:hypothetical protein
MRLYGTLNLGFAAAYAYFGFGVAPGRSTAFNLALVLVIALMIGSGIGLLLEAKWGRALGIVASGVLLAFAAVTVLLLVASSAYLKGVYGALGQGIATVSLLVAALVVEGFALLPIFELRFLLRKARA